MTPGEGPAALITEPSTEPGGPGPDAAPRAPARKGGYLGQFDSYRVVACGAVVFQHSFLWTVAGGILVPWAFVMLLHFSRTAFFFLVALLLTYSQVTRPRSTTGFWRRRFVQLGVPYLAWTLIYWLMTMILHQAPWSQAGHVLWNYTLYGYYQLYFVVVVFQLYLVFPLLLRLLRASRHHVAVMATSLGLALLLAADLHWPTAFGSLGQATMWLSHYWPWGRNVFTYQEQFVAGVLVGLHIDQVPAFIERWWRQLIGGAVLMLVAATTWYLVAVWTGSSTGRASDIYQPIAFLWFTAAVAGLECGSWLWYQRTIHGHPPRATVLSAEYLGALTGGIFLSHVLFINLLRSAMGGIGLTPHLGWAAQVAVLYVSTLLCAGLFTALVLRTPLRWVLGGPVRAEQRSRLNRLAGEQAARPDSSPQTQLGVELAG